MPLDMPAVSGLANDFIPPPSAPAPLAAWGGEAGWLTMIGDRPELELPPLAGGVVPEGLDEGIPDVETLPLAPVDGIFDTADETIDVDITPLLGAEPGPHVVAVRAFDAAGNSVVREVDTP